MNHLMSFAKLKENVLPLLGHGEVNQDMLAYVVDFIQEPRVADCCYAMKIAGEIETEFGTITGNQFCNKSDYQKYKPLQQAVMALCHTIIIFTTTGPGNDHWHKVRFSSGKIKEKTRKVNSKKILSQFN